MPNSHLQMGVYHNYSPPWSRFDPESTYGCSDAFSRFFVLFAHQGSPVLTRFAPLKDGHQTTHNTFLFHFSIVPPINSREIDRSWCWLARCPLFSTGRCLSLGLRSLPIFTDRGAPTLLGLLVSYTAPPDTLLVSPSWCIVHRRVCSNS